MYVDRQVKVAYAFIGIVIGRAVARNISTIRTERKKRQQILAWQQENIACIHNAKIRLFEMLESDEPISGMDLMTAWTEEMKFIDIVQNQPKYEI